MRAAAGRAVPGVRLEPLDVDEHVTMLHAWVTDPKAVFWMMQGATLQDVRVEYERIAADPDHHAWLGRVDRVPAFLAETYDPARSPLAGRYDARSGDLGMHVLVAPTEEPVRGFTARVFTAVMAHCFDDPAVGRLVVEPDERNHAVAELNARAGFLVDRLVDLPDKRAALSLCTRERFAESPLGRQETA
ncbi:GNAT family N-acetyltransferase [Aeromicrobium sp. CF4.19]|uniref:GNAT family N-acetyltransferase n=1 Tax=Aeromicrobium sp. CF4.19 TaxID=3373082 RepID=UPI003EE6A6AF